MKKIALCSLIVCLGYVNNAFSGCNPNNTLAYVGSQTPNHDEFLYWSKEEYDKAYAGWENSNHYTSGDGHGVECDSGNAGCHIGAIMEAPAGHVFKGQVVGKKQRYVCMAGDDRWEPVPDQSCNTKWGKLDVGKSYRNMTSVDCSGLSRTEENVGLVKSWEIVCEEGPSLLCKPYDCIENYKVNSATGKCELETNNPVGPNITNCNQPGVELATRSITVVATVCTGAPCLAIEAGKCYNREYLRCMEAVDEKVEKVVWNNNACICTDDKKEFNYDTRKCVAKSGKKTCEQLYPNASPERLACCHAGNATKWTGSEKSGTCTCVDSTKEWKYSNGTGVCRAKSGGDTTPETTKQCWYQFSADLKCVNGASVSKSTGYYVDVNGETCESFRAKFGDDKAFMLAMLNKFCSQQGSTPVVTDDKAFNAAKDSINAFFNNAKSDASVWKNAEGKFNTARLASDLTAGVVLGTVGGVVSGVVIKKKQVEKGFDALHCTVGGQKVADWGDEFNIGLRK